MSTEACSPLLAGLETHSPYRLINHRFLACDLFLVWASLEHSHSGDPKLSVSAEKGKAHWLLGPSLGSHILQFSHNLKRLKDWGHSICSCLLVFSQPINTKIWELFPLTLRAALHIFKSSVSIQTLPLPLIGCMAFRNLSTSLKDL